MQSQHKFLWEIGTAYMEVSFLMDNILLRSFLDPLIYELHGRARIAKGLISVICWHFSLRKGFYQKIK